tara:strand:+ start:61 stop:642 length:582 start_codon:yes stop_codon:yes gene_type:complete
MKLSLECEAFYYRNFIDEVSSSCIIDYLKKHFDLNELEKIELPGSEAFHIKPWKFNFLSEELKEKNLFPDHHGRHYAAFPELTELFQKVNQKLKTKFDVCVCLFYPDGKEFIDFHHDYPAFGPTNIIASLSLGAPRNFLIREQTTKVITQRILLESNSLLVMGEGFQEKYEHSLPADPETSTPRFNFTFRQFA